MTDEPVEAGGGNGTGGTCPACGVAVAPGYPRCPKCHAALPDAPPLGGNASAQRVQGGTSTAAESPRSWLWVAGAAGLALLGVIGFFVLRSSEKHPGAPPPPAASPAEVPAAPNVAAAEQGADVAPDPSAPAEPSRVQQQLEAAASLREALDNRRLWASVNADHNDLSIHSAYCNDAAMAGAIDELEKDLGAAGITHVGCYERHGPLVFERTISPAAGGR